MDITEEVKAFIYSTKITSIATIQRKLKLNYNTIILLLKQLEQTGLLKPLTEQGQRAINWQHPDWQNIASQPSLWQQWIEKPSSPITYRLEQNAEQHWFIVLEINTKQTLITFVNSQADGLQWLDENSL